MTHKERISAVFRGEMVDVIPWVPRIDLWHNANELAGTLPEKFKDMTVEQIHRAMGWPLHKIVPEYLKPRKREDIQHQGLGLYDLKEFVYTFEFPKDVHIKVQVDKDEDEEMTHVEYHTPVGMVSVTHGQTSEMKKSGASVSWVKEHAIKGPADYKVLAYIFGNLTLKPSYERYEAWRQTVGDDGLAATQSLGVGCTSPMHFIQKTLLDATQFYLHYNDFAKEMAELVDALTHTYNQILDIVAGSGADAVFWSANVDDMITYPGLYKEHFLPWCHKAADKLSPAGIFTIIHPDGENLGLMDLIAESRMDVADAVTPYPMTKVKIEQYYDRWCRSGKLTIHGGIPEMLLLDKSSSWNDLKGYLDNLFKVIAPGSRFVASIGDTTPPAADFERLIYIGDRIAEEGRLPLAAGSFRPVIQEALKAHAKPVPREEKRAPMPPEDSPLYIVLDDVLKGDQNKIIRDVSGLLDKGFDAGDILHNGMLPAMEIIGTKFTDGTVFIPEVLLSARALNEGLTVLEPHLAAASQSVSAKIMIGTVRGDLHDIGKNIVITMLKGVGFNVIDLGVNVKVADFVAQVSEHKPAILGLSALLTTTMPQIKDVINALTEAGLREKVKIMIGGAPVNQKFSDDVGSDGYAADAGDAVSLAKRLLA